MRKMTMFNRMVMLVMFNLCALLASIGQLFFDDMVLSPPVALVRLLWACMAASTLYFAIFELPRFLDWELLPNDEQPDQVQQRSAAEKEVVEAE